MSEIVRVSELRKDYQGKQVLKGISFAVQKGETFALLGANGAGKTTTLECMEGIRSFHSGRINICGFNPGSAQMRHHTGVQLQSASLPENITGREAIQLFSDWAGTLAHGDELLVSKELEKKRYGSMSTGQQRRLHLILAMLHNPDILFLDEPTAGLDIEGRVTLHNVIRRWKSQGKTILLASHDMAEVEALCDHVAVLREGKIVFDGTPAEMSRSIQGAARLHVSFTHPMKAAFKGCQFERETNGEEIYAVSDLNEGIEQLCAAAKANGNEIVDIRLERPTLEESFIEIVKGEGRS